MGRSLVRSRHDDALAALRERAGALFAAALVDRWGPRRLLLAGLGIFAAMSPAGGTASGSVDDLRLAMLSAATCLALAAAGLILLTRPRTEEPR
jgi:MFS family permease